ITIRGMEVKNRLAFPPMLSMSSDANGCPTEKTYNVYATKARGGTGLITYEAVSVEPVILSARNVSANIGKDDNIPVYKELTEAVHKYGAKIGMQLADGGLIGFVLASIFGFEIEPRGPSSVDLLYLTSAYEVMVPSWPDTLKQTGAICKEMSIEDIIRIEDLFAAGAKRAIQAGFDFIEIHSAHATLHSAFLAPYSNVRTDEYGGSTENRCNFLLETMEKIRKSIGDKPPLFVRISADELVPDGLKIEETKKIAQIIENAGIDCIDVSQGNMIRNPKGIQIPTYVKQGGFIHLAEEIKKVVNVPVIGVGRIVDPRMADEYIQQGKADIIYMGRQLICDADTPNKYFNGQLDDIKYCMGCLQGCTTTCVYDAYSGQNYKALRPSTDLKKIVVLGAGIAGMEAARVAKLRGHEVEIYEKSDKIGGLIPLLAMEYKKEEFMNIVNYLGTQLKKLEVPIYLNKELTSEEISDLKPDILVLATGTEATIPKNLEGTPNIVTQDEAILKSKPIGKNIVIWGLGAYWRGGPETAITLAEQGYNVKALMGSNTTVATEMLLATGRRFWILEYLRDNKIPIYIKAKLLDVTEKGVRFLDENKSERFIEADTLVYCGSRVTSGKKLKKQLEGVAPKIELIGDCKRSRDIAGAMNDAQTFARRLK
ncbi:MAG: FAD-dependent oxidoreductase, partial [Candidatus Helarchaeota archaeon]|nr:FAD-dependent oxidoreductase [Candidatus Helarchaeota archaeon]